VPASGWDEDKITRTEDDVKRCRFGKFRKSLEIRIFDGDGAEVTLRVASF